MTEALQNFLFFVNTLVFYKLYSYTESIFIVVYLAFVTLQKHYD